MKKCPGTGVGPGNAPSFGCETFENSRASLILLCGLVGLLFSLALSAQAVGYAATQPATEITANTAKLNGMATPNRQDSVAWFEWGRSSNFGQVTGPSSAGNGTNVVRISAAIGGLVPGGSYHCRFAVSNAAGIAFQCGKSVGGNSPA